MMVKAVSVLSSFSQGSWRSRFVCTCRMAMPGLYRPTEWASPSLPNPTMTKCRQLGSTLAIAVAAFLVWTAEITSSSRPM